MTLPSPVRPLALAAAVVACVACVASACEVPEDVSSSASAGDASPSELTLASADVCLDVGYLCAPLADSASFRVLRWPDGQASVAVHVPIPAGVARSDGRRLQAAAARGIGAWDGAPLRIDAHAAAASADIVVTWVPSLPDSRLGLARVEWAQRGTEVRFAVPRFELATHASGAAPRLHTPAEVELVAVHEMGHALGLPHSDREADVMFPTRTARRLTTRDHRTAMALYGLPGGARVVRD